MTPRIEIITGKKLVGRKLAMTFANNQTFKLWQGFMPRRKEIKNTLTPDLLSMQLYPAAFDFTSPDINVQFEKWAAVEVSGFEAVPSEMETYILPGGLYAVFHYKGLSTDNKVFEYIHREWLPASKYLVDSRPHFEVLGDKYRNNDPNSEEEIWIPVKPWEP